MIDIQNTRTRIVLHAIAEQYLAVSFILIGGFVAATKKCTNKYILHTGSIWKYKYLIRRDLYLLALLVSFPAKLTV